MRFTEVYLDHPLLREALLGGPKTEIEWVRNTSTDGNWEMLFWANGGDLGAFDSAVRDDPTVTVLRSVNIGGQRLYNVNIVGKGAETDLYPVLVESGGVVMSATVTSDGWFCRFGFFDQAGIDRFFEVAQRHDIDFEVHQIYRPEDFQRDGDLGLTDIQRETLLVALESGYFDVPRQADQQDLSESLGASDTAVSQRIRRGIRNLLNNTLDTDANHAPATSGDRSR